MKSFPLQVTVNKKRYQLDIAPNLTLLDLLRDRLGLTGTKCGCEIGECGACTVLLHAYSFARVVSGSRRRSLWILHSGDADERRRIVVSFFSSSYGDGDKEGDLR
jgi:hypothetical protein